MKIHNFRFSFYFSSQKYHWVHLRAITWLHVLAQPFC